MGMTREESESERRRILRNMRNILGFIVIVVVILLILSSAEVRLWTIRK